MKALVWNGKNSVKVQDVPKPRVVEDRDVILKVTGSTESLSFSEHNPYSEFFKELDFRCS